VSNSDVGFHPKLFILPIFGLALFIWESHRCFQGQRRALKQEGACFWWANVPLDSKPLAKYQGFWTGDLTECDFEAQQFIDRARPPWAIGLLELTAAPALITAVGISHGLGKTGVSEIPSFMAGTPVLIFIWYYFVSFLIARIARRRRVQALATNH
jgi:hypothetical protein